MYVYEYGQDCPPPNCRRVYISYLDSINFFQPREYRTVTYHSILIEYLRYVKKRGFHTAHIWSCPPSKGDDFIFHVHPPQQKIPRDDMLCNWYQTMLTSAESEGVVIKTTTLYDEYFKLDGSKVFAEPTCIPYFEGDYIPGEVENIIKHLNKEEQERSKLKNKDADISGIVSKARSTEEKLVGNKRGTRSNPGELCNIEPDKVMKRLGQSLGRIKPNFFVAYLHSRAFAEAADSGQDVSKWTEEDDDEFKCRSPFIVGKDASVLSDTRSPEIATTKSNVDHDSVPMETDLKEPETVESQNSGCPLVSAEKSANDDDQPGAHTNTASEEDALVSFVNDTLRSDIEVDDSNVVRKYIGSTVDIDPPVERELFESRQQLLNYCQSRHYQFDELRRAKYTTMMVRRFPPVRCPFLHCPNFLPHYTSSFFLSR